MVEGLLKGLKKEDELQGPLSSKVLDQGDAVGAWFGKDQGGPLAAILFATSETLKQVILWTGRRTHMPETRVQCFPPGETCQGVL